MKFLRRARHKPENARIDPTTSNSETLDIIEPPTDQGPADASTGSATTGWHSTQPFKAGFATHVGCVRSRNEDSILVLTLSLLGEMTDLTFGLFMVADGMGGHSDGQKASQLATRVVAREIMGRLYGPFLQADDWESPQPVLTTLAESLQAANWRISRENPESGTTLTAGLTVGNRLYVAHVGDSRAYLISDNGTEPSLLTLDHTFVQRLQDSGQISAQEALIHPKRNVLYRAVGQGERLEIDTFSRMIPRPGWLLLCSDGLWGTVQKEHLIGTVTGTQDPQQACDALVSAALEAGAPDNVSAVVVRFENLPPEPTVGAGTGTGL